MGQGYVTYTALLMLLNVCTIQSKSCNNKFILLLSNLGEHFRRNPSVLYHSHLQPREMVDFPSSVQRNPSAVFPSNPGAAGVQTSVRCVSMSKLSNSVITVNNTILTFLWTRVSLGFGVESRPGRFWAHHAGNKPRVDYTARHGGTQRVIGEPGRLTGLTPRSVGGFIYSPRGDGRYRISR